MTADFARRAGRTVPALAAAGPGRVHVAAWDTVDREPVTVAADDAVPAASTIKVPILAAALAEADAGRVDLAEPYPLSAGRTGGSGVLDALHHLDKLSLADLLALMIVVSDNAATNVVIDAVGFAAVNAFCDRAGLTATRLGRRLMDTAAKARGLENVTSARDQARLLDGLANRTLLPERSSTLAMDVLAGQQFNDKLPALLPAEATVAHKTGEVSDAHHDVGIIANPQGRHAVVAVLVTEVSRRPSDPAGVAAVRHTIAEIGLACYRALDLGSRYGE